MFDLTRISEIVQAVRQLSNPEARESFLNAACGSDQELKHRVLAKLTELERAATQSQIIIPVKNPITNPLTTPGTSPPTQIDLKKLAEQSLPKRREPRTPEGVGTIIGGRYTLVCQLGTGGMGTVWLAEQTAPMLRRVAVKLIKPELVSNRVLARFEAERQALALMDHPNIAKVFDAGTTETGRPYFVMELVEGTNLTDFCDARRLTIRQRIELFLLVCRAVHHAHQKGIIHRDLKPTNILVASSDGHPIPKVIDFGLAKAIGTGVLSDAVKSSTLGRIVGTPLYMSPEQASGSGAIDTRTDVYALGVVLYELLVGATPIEPSRLKPTSPLEDVIRAVCDEPTLPPSERASVAFQYQTIPQSRQENAHSLRHVLQGELDTIIMKAISKSPDDRYASVSELEADLTRYMNDEPIQALAGSRLYRLKKYARRNRGVAIGTVVALLTLLIGLASSTWGLVLALNKRDQALERTEQAEKSVKELERILAVERLSYSQRLNEAEQNIKFLKEKLQQANDVGK